MSFRRWVAWGLSVSVERPSQFIFMWTTWTPFSIKAVAAGAQVRMPLADMFWGDRYGVVTDPFGHKWSVATHKEDLTPEEISKRAQAAFGGCVPSA